MYFVHLGLIYFQVIGSIGLSKDYYEHITSKFHPGAMQSTFSFPAVWLSILMFLLQTVKIITSISGRMNFYSWDYDYYAYNSGLMILVNSVITLLSFAHMIIVCIHASHLISVADYINIHGVHPRLPTASNRVINA
jgi:hypothetical protein